jgi:hypothetical protein
VRPDGIFILFIFVGIPWVLGWIAKTHWNHQRHMKILQLKAEANARLLDRLGSDPSVLDLLKSDAQQLLFDVKTADAGMPMPYARMLTSVQAACFLLTAGIACLVYRSTIPPEAWARSGQAGFLFFGAMGVALAIGALLSAGAAFVTAHLLKRQRLEEERI